MSEKNKTLSSLFSLSIFIFKYLHVCNIHKNGNCGSKSVFIIYLNIGYMCKGLKQGVMIYSAILLLRVLEPPLYICQWIKKQNCYHPIYLCASDTVHKPSYLPLLIPETLHKCTYVHPLLTKQPNARGNRWETESPCVHITTMPITCWVILRKPHIFS